MNVALAARDPCSTPSRNHQSRQLQRDSDPLGRITVIIQGSETVQSRISSMELGFSYKLLDQTTPIFNQLLLHDQPGHLYFLSM